MQIFYSIPDLYEYRVFYDGTQDVKARAGIFKLVFRTKFNNSWDPSGSIKKYKQ